MRIGRSPAPVIFDSNHRFEIGKATRIKDGKDITVIATGVMVARAIEASDILKKKGISVRVVNLSTIKPLDNNEVLSAAKETGAIVTAEDHNVMGGMGSAVSEFVSQNHPVQMKIIGVNDRFGKSGESDELAQYFGLTAEHICKSVEELLAEKGGK